MENKYIYVRSMIGARSYHILRVVRIGEKTMDLEYIAQTFPFRTRMRKNHPHTFERYYTLYKAEEIAIQINKLFYGE